jgi:formylglycine-generating enzyme required for sulfatase activity
VRDGACPKLSTWAAENPNPLIPATSISYTDATAFLAWLSAQSGRTYRLPSEAEWEYASRAGAATAFPWGDEISPSAANYDQTARYRGSPTAPYRGYPEAVTAYPPNAFGLYQTQGNVWEWTAGCVDAACRNRVVRGGSFESVPAELRAANRFAVAPSKRRDDVGLRVARDLEADELAGVL